MADLEAVAAAALGCPLIAGLTGGQFGEIATYLPGRRVQGVRQADGAVEVHVVARWGTPLPEVADLVRAAVAPYADGLPVAVFVDDIEVPENPAEAALEAVGRGAS
ncbi:MAG TPA: hypothetical protein VHT97_13470 [Acidimicrobiales bacterium]|jgi:hypothetical protein|nr:hypothetical protein [Acidimicrobiales bacterium]